MLPGMNPLLSGYISEENLTLLKKDFLDRIATIIPPPRLFSKPPIKFFFFYRLLSMVI